MKCRHCDVNLSTVFVDLNASPPSNSYLTNDSIKNSEKWYPLKVMVCEECWLVQTEDFVGADEMFSEDYAYFSSFSSSWLEHASNYVDSVVTRFNLTETNNIVEVAANDGYLLQYVMQKKIPCYGIEPTHSTAVAARNKGIEIIEEFFGEQKAKELVRYGRQADLTVANNVLAHVPDINDFVKGFATLLTPNGVATFEFPHLLNLENYVQFDTIYHEHYSYLSLIAVKSIFEKNGLSVFDVTELPTHGGSLRVYSQRSDTGQHSTSLSVPSLLIKEKQLRMNKQDFYQGFQNKVEKVKVDFLEFLISAKKNEKIVVAYGAAAKGSTLMNFVGIQRDFIKYVVDKNPNKIGKYMPGSRLPILEESQIRFDKPDYVVIFPWNLSDEIMKQLSYIREWNGSFVIAVPELKIIKA